MAAKKISSIKKKSSYLYEIKNKDTLRIPQESAMSYSFPAKKCKSVDLSFQRNVPNPALEEPMRELVS